MAKKTLYLANGPWEKAITAANTYYNHWTTKYKCKQLEEYYKGFQWRNKFTGSDIVNYEPYTLNLFFSTIQIKLSSLVFQKPEFILSPRANAFWDEETAVQSSEIKQDALNTLISNPLLRIPSVMKKICRDSFFYFGLAEVGYAADWRNPLKDSPLLKSHEKGEEEIPLEKDRIVEDVEVPINERVYVRRIRPNRFRCCVTDEWDLDSVEWYGYYQYFFKRTLQKTKGINWPKDADVESFTSSDYGSVLRTKSNDSEDANFLRLVSNKEIVKVWHIWDNVKKERLLLLDGGFQELWSESFDRRSLIDLRWEEEDGFYPVPPTFHWLSPQNEINEQREQTRSFRRRFTRKFQYVNNTVDLEEVEKFVSGPDGSVIKVKQKDAITPIQNPELGQTAAADLMISKDDFNIISGTSSEARGQADRTTATQAKLIDARSQIRESAEQLDFSAYFCLIGREILLTASEKLEGAIWTKISNAPQPFYQQIHASDLSDGYDYNIELDITNATPQSMLQSQQAFTTFMAMLSQFPMIVHDTDLIREAAYRCGYRNEKIIKKIQQAAIQQMAAAAAMQNMSSQGSRGGQMQGMPGSPNNNANKSTLGAQMETPDIQQIMNQVNGQIQ